MGEQPPQEVSAIVRLDDWYNPYEDGGRLAFEQFTHWADPPDAVFVRRDEDGKNLAVAYGGHEYVI